MALKEEKPQSMFNKWWAMRRALHVRDPDEPPPIIEDCNSLKECYRWRQTVMKEIGDKVAEIQNAGLGNYKIRALNDEINKLLNHKRMWEARIRQLGGPDFQKTEVRFYDSEGLELPGSGGYLYFGAAKDLPGVRQLFFQEAPSAPEINRDLLYKNLDEDYFGRTDETPELVDAMKQLENCNRTKKIEKWITDNFSLLLSKFPNIQEMSQTEIEHILEIENFDEQLIGKSTLDEENNEVIMREIERMKKELVKVYVGEIEKDKESEVVPHDDQFMFIQEYEDVMRN